MYQNFQKVLKDIESEIIEEQDNHSEKDDLDELTELVKEFSIS